MSLILISLCLLGTTGGDLLVVDHDIRELNDPSVLEQLDVVYISTDWFLATCELELTELSNQVVAEGPVQLEDYRLVHLREENDAGSAGAVGEVLLCRGNVALVRVESENAGLTAYPGVHLVQPLRVYSKRAVEPFQDLDLDDPDITSIVEAVDQDSLISYIQRLEDFETRLCVADSFYSACEWVDGKFASYGLSSEIESFDFVFYGTPYTSWNVAAEITGSVEPDVVVIICGHLDSITMNDPWTTAPGADDNGSGSAAVIEAARIMSEYDFRYTVRFLCFGAEELGLIGSEHYAEQAAAAGDSIIAVMNLDMILYAPAGYRSLFVPYNDISQELAMNMDTISAEYVPQLDVDVQYSPGTTYSDHASFWAQGYPALLGIETGVNENPYYHQEDDLLANYMEYFPFGTECAQAAIATVAVYADPVPYGIHGEETSEPLIESMGPVPCSSSLVMRFGPGMTAGKVSIFDISGREVAEESIAEGTEQVQLDVSNLPPGIYGVRIVSGGLAESRVVVIAE